MPDAIEYKTAEELAVELDVSIHKINQAAKGLQRVLLPGDNRRRFSPQDVARIKARVQADRK